MPRIYLPSRYAPIWNELKQNGKATVVAHHVLHRRIRKAVVKLKDQDTVFKLLLGEQFKYAILYSQVSGNTIHWQLKTFSTFQLGAF